MMCSETRAHRAPNDSGFTILEMVVAMGVFSVFIVIFVAAVSGFAGSIVSSRSAAEGAGTNETIVNNLDREVRYSDAINFPGAGATGIRYIEFQLPKSVTDTGHPGCFQWRYDPSTQNVSVRSWDISDSNTALNITGWLVKGQSIVDKGGVTYPFAMLPASISQSTLRQRLQITLSTGVAGKTTSDTQTTFVARNSSSVSVTNADSDGDGQSDTQVCMQAGGRP